MRESRGDMLRAGYNRKVKRKNLPPPCLNEKKIN